LVDGRLSLANANEATGGGDPYRGDRRANDQGRTTNDDLDFFKEHHG
jgi:hypothetical protein